MLVRYSNGFVELSVTDDGTGDGGGDSGGHGLVGMRERISRLRRRPRGGAAAGRRLPAEGDAPGGQRMSLTVLLVDDQSLVRAGFRMILEAEEDIEVVGEAGDGRQAVEQARALGRTSS